MYGVKYLVGLDLGQQQDYTVLTVLEIQLNKDLTAIYILRDMKIYPLKTDYVFIVNDVVSLLSGDNLKNKSSFIIDYSGVGSPIFDLFRIELDTLSPIGVSITGGNNTHWRNNCTAIVSKKDIVSTIQVCIQNNKLVIPSNINNLRKIEKELLNFKAKLTSHNSTVFKATGAGIHDDIVMSLGISLWYGESVNKRGKRLKMVGGA